MRMYWPGTGVSIDHRSNVQGDEWFALVKDGVTMAELPAADIDDTAMFQAFGAEIRAALARQEADAGEKRQPA